MHARRKLIGFGVAIILIGVLLQVISSNLMSFLYGSVVNAEPLGAFLINYVISVLSFGAAPLGAAMVALGLALHWIDQGKTLENRENTSE